MDVLSVTADFMDSIPVSDADVVLRQIIVSLGGVCIGAALIYAWWNVRQRREHAWITARQFVSYAMLAALTTEHIYSHLLQANAPVWQLWGALLAFALGAQSIISRIRRREVTVVAPEGGR